MEERARPSATAIRIVEMLKPHTPFAEAIVRRQAERANLPIQSLSEADLPKIIPLIVAAAASFVDPAIISQLKATFLRR